MRSVGTSVAVIALSVTCAAGCSAILGIGDLPGPGDDDGGAGASSGGSSSGGSGSGASSGAGGGTSSGSDNAAALAQFRGTWDLTGGSFTLSDCSNGVPDDTEPETPGAADVFVAGTTSDLVLIAGSCDLAVNLSGPDEVVQARAGQSCTDPSSGESIEVTTYSFTISGGTEADELITGTATVLSAGLTCKYSATATYEKQ
jgi:hypothetical protein